VLFAAPILAAAADGGVYLGAGVGRGRIQDETVDPASATTVTFDSKDTAYKGFVGYRFGGLPLIDVALELGYTDFGNPAQTSLGQRLEYKLRGGTAAGLLIFPIGPIDLIGKAGAVRWSAEKNIGGTASSRTGTNAFGGVGVGMRVWRLGLRAEYEYFDVKYVKRAEMVSVSAIFQF
jgi:hypothetical protein